MVDGNLRTARRRGRPPGSVRIPHDYRQSIWLAVEYFRERTKMRTGQRPSVSSACRSLVDGGGVAWAMGGNIEAVSSSIAGAARPAMKSWRRSRLRQDGRNFRIVNDPQGGLVIGYKIQHAGSLRTRYTEAAALARSSPAIHQAWTNMLRGMLGIPRLPVGRRVGRPPLI
jgi:hypothetical protein